VAAVPSGLSLTPLTIIKKIIGFLPLVASEQLKILSLSAPAADYDDEKMDQDNHDFIKLWVDIFKNNVACLG
jgi:hypothetical protein